MCLLPTPARWKERMNLSPPPRWPESPLSSFTSLEPSNLLTIRKRKSGRQVRQCFDVQENSGRSLTCACEERCIVRSKEIESFRLVFWSHVTLWRAFLLSQGEKSPSLRGNMAGTWGFYYGKVNNTLVFISTSQNILLYWCLFREKFNFLLIIVVAAAIAQSV